VAIIAALAALAVAVTVVGCGGSSEGAASFSPDGAPYAFELPQGFELAPARFPGEDPKFLTMLVPEGAAGGGGISAFQWTLGPAERRFSTPRLLRWLSRQTRSFYLGKGATLNRGIRTDVGGREAICWMVRGFDNTYEGVVDADACAIVGRHDVVQQACIWKAGRRAQIERGCAELRATLEVS